MIFGIFKTAKGENQPEFVGQVKDPDIKKVSEIAGKLTNGEHRKSMASCNGVIVSATTTGHHIDFVGKSHCADLICGSKKVEV